MSYLCVTALKTPPAFAEQRTKLERAKVSTPYTSLQRQMYEIFATCDELV